METQVQRPWADGRWCSHTALRVREAARCRHKIAGSAGSHARRRRRPRRVLREGFPKPLLARHAPPGQGRIHPPCSARAGWIYSDGTGGQALAGRCGRGSVGRCVQDSEGLEPDPRTFALEDEIRRTRDIFLGSSHNDPEAPNPFFRQPEYSSQPDEPLAYRDLGEYENHYVYLQGLWQSDEESIVHARETEEYEDYVAFKMVGQKVVAVCQTGTVRFSGCSSRWTASQFRPNWRERT